MVPGFWFQPSILSNSEDVQAGEWGRPEAPGSTFSTYSVLLFGVCWRCSSIRQTLAKVLGSTPGTTSVRWFVSLLTSFAPSLSTAQWYEDMTDYMTGSQGLSRAINSIYRLAQRRRIQDKASLLTDWLIVYSQPFLLKSPGMSPRVNPGKGYFIPYFIVK